MIVHTLCEIRIRIHEKQRKTNSVKEQTMQMSLDFSFTEIFKVFQFCVKAFLEEYFLYSRFESR